MVANNRDLRLRTYIKRALRIASMPILIPITIRDRPKHVDHFPDLLSVVAIAKNEGEYIREWVEFYKTIGVSRIYLYDNDSPDNMKDRIADFIEEGFVVYTLFPGIAQQYDAYMDAISKYKYVTKYMAFVDCDEFLMPCDPNASLGATVDELFKKYGKGVGGITVNWKIYGPSGHKTKPTGLVLEEYTQRKVNDYPVNATIKTIANPRAILYIRHAHYPIYYAGYRNVNVEGKRIDGPYDFSALEHDPHILRLNHYYSKSHEEYLERRSRRVADRKEPMIRSREVLEQELVRLDSDTVYDDSGLPHARDVKRLEAKIRSDK